MQRVRVRTWREGFRGEVRVPAAEHEGLPLPVGEGLRPLRGPGLRRHLRALVQAVRSSLGFRKTFDFESITAYRMIRLQRSVLVVEHLLLLARLAIERLSRLDSV